MSRGPGRWQRLILEGVKNRGAITDRQLFDSPPPPKSFREAFSREASIERAMRTLERRGQITVMRVAAGRAPTLRMKYVSVARQRDDCKEARCSG